VARYPRPSWKVRLWYLAVEQPLSLQQRLAKQKVDVGLELHARRRDLILIQQLLCRVTRMAEVEERKVWRPTVQR
jgi:hypothetical protein